MNNNTKIFNKNIGIYLWIINNKLSKTIWFSELWKYIKVQWWYSFKASKYVESGIPIIRISNFNNWKIILDKHKTKFYEESDKYKEFELNKWDIIIAMTGWTIWKLAIVQWWLWKIYLNQRVWRFKIINPLLVDNEYLYWIARWVENIVKSMWYWWAQPNVSWKQIESLKFPFPKKEIQKQIVSFLNDLMNWNLKNTEYFDKNIENKILKLHKKSLNINIILDNSQNNQNYIIQLKQQILQEAIEWKLTKSWREQHQDIEPASVLLEKIKKEKQELIKQKKLKKQKELKPIEQDEIPFDIPESWECCRLGEVYTYIQRWPSAKYSEKSNVWIINQKCIRWEKIDFSYIKYYKKELIEKLKEDRFIKKRDILLNSTWTWTIWRCYLVKDIYENKYIADSHVTILRENANFIDNWYVNTFLKSDFIQNFINNGWIWWATNQIELSKTIIENFIFPLPPLEEQKQIVQKVDELMKLCDELKKQTLEIKENSENLMKAVL